MKLIDKIKEFFEEVMSEWDAYETGPFCRHWSDPSECDEVCVTCGHKCHQHGVDEDSSQCEVEGCDCKKWLESE